MQIQALQINPLNKKMRFSNDKSFGEFSEADSLQYENNSIKISTLPLNRKTKFNPVVISFKGVLGKNPQQIALVGAEFDPYYKVGGVSTVMRDYFEIFNDQIGTSTDPQKRYGDARIFIPYYNGAVQYDNTGQPTGEIKVLEKNNVPIFTNKDLTKIGLSKLDSKDYVELEEVSRKIIELAGAQEEVVLYKVKDKNHYMVYTNATARMKAPYVSEKGKQIAYSSTFDKESANFLGDPYAKFNKAFVELLPTIEEQGFNPKHIICSDPQSAFVPQYMLNKIADGNAYYRYTNASYVMHNLGRGYQGVTNARDMFFNLADAKTINAVSSDKNYLEAIRDGQGDEYFKRFFPDLIDECGEVNTTMIPIRLAQQRFLTHINTVSEEYAKAAAYNPEIALGITKFLEEGYGRGWFGGILNGFEDALFHPEFPFVEFKYYSKPCLDANTGITHSPFKTFSKNMSFEEISEIKRENSINLLQRLIENASPQYAVGKDNAKCEIIGHIDKNWIEELKEKKQVNLFVAWGRGDSQKGHDITLSAFEKFAKTKAGKNAVLVMGGQLNPKTEDFVKIKSILERMQKDKDLKGRFVYLDGFIPNKPIISAATAAILPARFAPCELTDLESMRFGTTPIVTNHQGLAQKNFDPRYDTKFPPTSYKTKHEYYMPAEEIIKCSKGFRDEFANMIDKEADRLITIEVCHEKNITTLSLAEKNITTSKEYEKLLQKWKDDIIADEIADCMKEKATESTEMRKRMMFNALNTDTRWKSNNILHPNKMSSFEMYVKYHLERESAYPETELFIKAPFKEKFEFLRINYTHLRLRRFLRNRYVQIGFLATLFTGLGIAFVEIEKKRNEKIKKAELEKELYSSQQEKITMHLIKDKNGVFPKEFAG